MQEKFNDGQICEIEVNANTSIKGQESEEKEVLQITNRHSLRNQGWYCVKTKRSKQELSLETRKH